MGSWKGLQLQWSCEKLAAWSKPQWCFLIGLCACGELVITNHVQRYMAHNCFHQVLINQSDICVWVLGTNTNTFSMCAGLRQGSLSSVLFFDFHGQNFKALTMVKMSTLGTSKWHLCFLRVMWFCWLYQSVTFSMQPSVKWLG